MDETTALREQSAFYRKLGVSHETAERLARKNIRRAARLNAEIRAAARARFRNMVAEYALNPDLFLRRSAVTLRRPSVATIEDACVLHARAADALRRNRDHWTFDPNNLAAHEQLLLIARYLRRFGERKRAALRASMEAA